METEPDQFQAAFNRLLQARQRSELMTQARLLLLESKVEAMELTLQALAIRVAVDPASVVASYNDMSRQLAVARFAKEMPDLPADMQCMIPQPDLEEGAQPTVV